MAFLVFEGLDGSGKSSLMRALEDELKKRNQPVRLTREPGGTALGDELRELILRKDPPCPTPRTELLLYEASRSQHVDEVIRPLLAQKIWVLSDRYSASSVAFQGSGRSISNEDVIWLNRFATGGLEADLTILLDLSVEEARRRRQGRSQSGGQVEDRIEAEAEAFHERVRQSFLAQAHENPARWLVLKASETPEVLFQNLLKSLRERRWLD